MKYSSRELKLFNVFALFLFSLGGVFFTVGIAQFAMRPKHEYVVSKSLMNAGAKATPTETNSSGTYPSKSVIGDDIMTLEGTNFSAVSNGLVGAVFMALSFALNRVLLRVMRHDGKDIKAKQKRQKTN